MAASEHGNSSVNRGRSATRSRCSRKRGQLLARSQCSPLNRSSQGLDPSSCNSSFATASTESVPKSHSPESRTSVYAANVQRCQNSRLQSLAMHPQGVNEYPGVRCVVTSLPYNNSELSLSGLYSGMMDIVTRLPDGDGILYCYDGRVFDEEWCLGGMRSLNLSQTCESSMCSSLSASVTRLPVSETRDKKLKVPKCIYVNPRSSASMVALKTNLLRHTLKRRSTLSTTQSGESFSDQTDETNSSSQSSFASKPRSTKGYF